MKPVPKAFVFTILGLFLGISPACSEGLSLEAAYKTALLKNRGIRPAYAALDRAEMDRLQTAVLSDPKTDVRELFPDRSPADSHHLLRAGDCVLELREEVRSAYYALQAAHAELELAEDKLLAATAARTLAQKQLSAGNISVLENAELLAHFGEIVLETQRARIDARVKKHKLTALMGLADAEDTLWSVEPEFPPPSREEPPLKKYEDAALSRSLGLSAAKAELEVLQGADPAKPIGYIQEVNLGAVEETGYHSLCHQGKMLGIPLYILGAGAREASLRSMLTQAGKARLPELELSLLTNVRRAYAKVTGQREILEHHRDALIPAHQRIVSETQKRHNGMLAGIYQLLSAKQHELSARAAEIAALKDYWTAKAELERLAGGAL